MKNLITSSMISQTISQQSICVPSIHSCDLDRGISVLVSNFTHY